MKLRSHLTGLFLSAVIFTSGCDYIAPPRWVLWIYSVDAGGWVAMAEYRTLKACQDVMLSLTTSNPTPKCLPYGAVP
jgi:hypothetical protein